jgi:lysylphosphatidylglycerol synthetase-like protein (DUF2156 family)
MAFTLFDPVFTILLPTSLICIILAVFLYDIFLSMDYIRLDPSIDPWINTAGFNHRQFYAFLTGTVLGPIGLLLLLIFSIHAYKSAANSIVKGILFSLLLAASITSSVYSYPMGQEILDCGIFCVGYSDADSSTNSIYGHGAVVSVGVMYFILSLTSTVLFAYLLCLTIKDSISPSKLSPHRAPLLNHPSHKVSHRQNYIHTLNIGFTLGVLFPFIIFLVTSLPTWWAHFTRYRLAKYSSQTSDQKYGYHWTIEINDDLHLYIFPDIFMYYTCIYIVCLVGMLSKTIPGVRQQLSTRPTWIPFKRSFGEFLLLLLFMSLIIAQFLYFYTEHCYERKPCGSRSDMERAARAAGLVGNLILGLLLLPVSRQSFLTHLFDIPWEQMLE